MLRRSTLRHTRSTMVLVVLAIAVPTLAARAQDRAMQDRLDRLERDLSMLQRQVYHGGASPAVPGGVDTELRMDRLETQMRELTGRVEEAANAVEQLRRRLEQVNSDVEVRFGQEQGQTASAPPRLRAGATDASPAAVRTAIRGAPPGPNQMAALPPDPVLPPGTLVPPPPGSARGFGTLTPPGPESTMDPANAGVSANLGPAGTGALPGGSVSDQYNFAFGLLKQADYSAAEEALKNFIRQHPDDALAGGAQYWLGETYYARGRYAEAAAEFAEGYKRYPKGAKAADDLLKLGMSLGRANQRQNACIAFAQLDHDFPNPAAAIKDRARDEKKKLGC